MFKQIIAGACAAWLAGASQAAATTTVTVDASHLGWYTASGRHDVSNINTLTGELFEEYRSFYEWTLPAVGHITGAHLEMALPYSLGVSQGTQTGAMFDVTAANRAFLNRNDGAGHGVAIFDDLGTGTGYGDFTIAESDNLTTFVIDLDADAVRAIDAARGGTFALGMRNTTPRNLYDYFLFSSGSEAGRQALVLDVAPVPETSSLALMGLGAVVVGLATRRRRAASRG